MAKNYSYEQIAEDFELWGEYVDPNATMTEQEFDELSTDDKVKMQEEMFGKDESESDN